MKKIVRSALLTDNGKGIRGSFVSLNYSMAQ